MADLELQMNLVNFIKLTVLSVYGTSCSEIKVRKAVPMSNGLPQVGEV